ncbi:uncharacterized protein PgNI_11822 [Pyricularia grisea]|uniref:Uncharacterized protein n=1 Tax=Pyricularia grisea TaxID=148305 RepID=A0A6P8AP41_PYRGI|nr:uncharacterized protein PgNI_11822 [Pyricularia grisea]TLD03802.1 hypothetical protein PgNI_11822 [Pyricularia grisea]
MQESELMVRNVFIYKTVDGSQDGSQFLLGYQTRNVMENTFRLIEANRIADL